MLSSAGQVCGSADLSAFVQLRRYTAKKTLRFMDMVSTAAKHLRLDERNHVEKPLLAERL